MPIYIIHIYIIQYLLSSNFLNILLCFSTVTQGLKKYKRVTYKNVIIKLNF